MYVVLGAGVVAPQPAEEAAPLQGSQTAKQKQEAGPKLSSLIAQANGDAGELLLAWTHLNSRRVRLKALLSHRPVGVLCVTKNPQMPLSSAEIRAGVWALLQVGQSRDRTAGM